MSLERRTARIVLIGQRGSGKATLAGKLALKYNLITIDTKVSK
jgi:adenylate kinase family enzyme